MLEQLYNDARNDVHVDKDTRNAKDPTDQRTDNRDPAREEACNPDCKTCKNTNEKVHENTDQKVLAGAYVLKGKRKNLLQIHTKNSFSEIFL